VGWVGKAAYMQTGGLPVVLSGVGRLLSVGWVGRETLLCIDIWTREPQRGLAGE
jgi:hypothetical protein